MRLLVFAAALLLLATLLSGCNRPTVDECEQLCRDYAKLAYWEQAEEEIEAQPPGEERGKVREEKSRRWEEAQEDDVFLRRLDNCVTDCRQRATKDDLTCVAGAKKVAEAAACLAD